MTDRPLVTGYAFGRGLHPGGPRVRPLMGTPPVTSPDPVPTDDLTPFEVTVLAALRRAADPGLPVEPGWSLPGWVPVSLARAWDWDLPGLSYDTFDETLRRLQSRGLYRPAGPGDRPHLVRLAPQDGEPPPVTDEYLSRLGELARRSGLEEAAAWHDAEAARLDKIASLGGVRPPTDHSFRVAALADEHRRSAAAIRAMKETRP